MELGVWVYVKLLLSSALVSGLINLGYNWWKDHRERAREASALALDACEALEVFARVCARTINDGHAAREEAGRLHDYGPLYVIKLPPFSYPVGMAWKWLAPSIASRPPSTRATRPRSGCWKSAAS